MPRHSQQISLAAKFGFLLGWGFFALAFLLAAAEATLARHSLFTSANDLLLTLAPGKWIAFKHHYDSVLLKFLIATVLQLPGWLLAGLPAALLIWTCRPHREDMDPDLYHSLTTFDRLAKMAEEDGAQDDDPTFQEYDPHDYDDDLQKDDVANARSYMKDWHPEEVDEQDIPPRPKGPHERMDSARDNLTIPFDKLS
ncbi:hypothetical protein [Terasakiella sp.]|uniref:hypothetical protein n=1 Tax=Terasakiella sp. TaxID=2034861 RepID=UPI003AA7CD61